MRAHCRPNPSGDSSTVDFRSTSFTVRGPVGCTWSGRALQYTPVSWSIQNTEHSLQPVANSLVSSGSAAIAASCICVIENSSALTISRWPTPSRNSFHHAFAAVLLSFDLAAFHCASVGRRGASAGTTTYRCSSACGSSCAQCTSEPHSIGRVTFTGTRFFQCQAERASCLISLLLNASTAR
jgi:hypothetical protein